MENKNNQGKKNSVNGGLYIALAICILSVICVGVYSAIINIFKGNTDEISDNLPIIVDENDKNVVVPKQREPEVKDVIFDEPEISPTEESDYEFPTEEKQVVSEPENDAAPTSFSKPVGGDVLKPFSSEVLVYSQTMNDYRSHIGVDLASNIGDAVKCFADGRIEEIYEDALMGQTIVISHGGNLMSIYSNLSPALPEGIVAGVEVKEGDVIAGVGETCLIECEEAPHLHFEVLLNNENVDPMEYFK